MLSLAGALVGVVLAAWGLDFASSMTGAWLPRSSEVGINLPVLAFTVAAALLTGIVFGLAPSLHVTQAALAETLKSTSRGTTPGGHQRLRAVFVVSEVALAFVLLICAGLLVRSFQQLQSVHPGFQPDQTITAVVSLPDARYPTVARQEQFTAPLLERVRRMPNVRAAALASFIPFDGKEALLTFEVAGEPSPPPSSRRLAQWRVVSDGFFETLGVPLVKGRTFSRADTSSSPKVAVIGRALASKYFAAKDPIGQRITLDDDPDSKTAEWFTVVGVVDDVRFRRLTDSPRPQLYFTVSQQQFPEFTLVAKTGPDPFAVVSSLRGIVRSLDAAIPLNDVRTMEDVVSSSVAGERFRTNLLVTFALIALVLSTIGVYGVMSYSVEQRAPEMGLRMALGASPRDVLRLVAGHGLKLAAAGVAIGLVAAFWLTRLLASLLFGVSATDPLTFGGDRDAAPRRRGPRELPAGPARDAEPIRWWCSERSRTYGTGRLEIADHRVPTFGSARQSSTTRPMRTGAGLSSCGPAASSRRSPSSPWSSPRAAAAAPPAQASRRRPRSIWPGGKGTLARSRQPIAPIRPRREASSSRAAPASGCGRRSRRTFRACRCSTAASADRRSGKSPRSSRASCCPTSRR